MAGFFRTFLTVIAVDYTYISTRQFQPGCFRQMSHLWNHQIDIYRGPSMRWYSYELVKQGRSWHGFDGFGQTHNFPTYILKPINF